MSNYEACLKPKIVASPVFTLSYTWYCVSVYFKKLYMRSCFVKQFIKMTPAPLEMLMELKPPKNGFTSEVEPSQTGPYLNL